MTLRELKVGQHARIDVVGGEGALRQHFLDMGVIPGAEVTLVKLAPLGDPMELRIHGYELTLRLADAGRIDVTPIPALTAQRPPSKRGKEAPHLGLGEDGKYHAKGSGDPLPEGELLTFALVGNQNSGKTTLFNQLTGANQHVGNFPGVTVDRKDGVIRGNPNTRITDLPGIYSMSPYSKEELVSRDFVLREKPKAIINIVDATNIERNLYLTMQLLEMGVPTVVALNMMDEVSGNGGAIDINGMEAALGVPVVPISAAKNQGVDELVRHAVHIAHYQEKPLRQDFCPPAAPSQGRVAATRRDSQMSSALVGAKAPPSGGDGGAVHRCLHAVTHLIEDHALRAGLPPRFSASKLIEGDQLLLEQLELDQNERETLEHIVAQMEKERGLDRSAAIADMRFAFIRRVCERCVTHPHESRERLRSERIDRLLTGKWTALPMFILIMGLVFFLTFNVIGPWLQDLVALGVEALTDAVDGALTSAGVNEVVHGLIIGGVFEGVGSVLSFLPIIVTLFFFLSLLEDSGYIARVAFFMDKLLRRVGLSGRSIVPMLIGFGCTVPAVMSTRTLPSERDRKMTILLTPFMSCTAKVPIYAFFVSAFFPRRGGLVMIELYLLGIVVGILVALLFKNTLFKGEAVPFVMELPNYRLPSPRNVGQLLWDKAKDFLQRAFSVILIATIVVWVLKSFDLRFNLVEENGEGSILALLAGWIAPLFRPLGLGDWRVCTALISGFMAKESVVSVLQVLYPGNVAAAMSALSAASLLVFSLLYTPCVAAVASIRRELGGRWALGVVLWQCAVAWVAALLVRLIGMVI